MRYNSSVIINDHIIDITSPTYFVADIAANHNGDLGMAKELIHLAKKAGADAVKFQHFLADSIVSDYGFKNLGHQSSHQAKNVETSQHQLRLLLPDESILLPFLNLRYDLLQYPQQNTSEM